MSDDNDLWIALNGDGTNMATNLQLAADDAKRFAESKKRRQVGLVRRPVPSLAGRIRELMGNHPRRGG